MIQDKAPQMEQWLDDTNQGTKGRNQTTHHMM